jgi:hypothetical protein
MGAEAICNAKVNGKRVSGRARLEMDTLEFRAPERRLSIPFKQMRRIVAEDGALVVESDQGTLSLALGPVAAKWADKIRNPPSRLDKIGAKPEWRASAVGIDDRGFLKEMGDRIAQLSIGRVLKDSDAIFFGATDAAQLSRLATLKRSLKPAGALWVIRPKGRKEISEQSVMAAGKAAGLVDVKVVSFSPTHTAEKFVIPVKDRAMLTR